MRLKQFINWADHGGHPPCFLIRCVDGSGYLLEVEVHHKVEAVLDKKGNPYQFDSQEQAETFLTKHGIHEAKLVVCQPEDEGVEEAISRGGDGGGISIEF
ncbi:DUF6482 family protein [Dongshaea marina]|uniref:DUF6482 family protein n=1 Tax=Dongshaea marina TaxID=2047966 RepID=UPI000D3EB6F3|nr:DUF6482 family protein [Dongshaea marina]